MSSFNRITSCLTANRSAAGRFATLLLRYIGITAAVAITLGTTPARSADSISVGYQPIINGPLWIARHEGYFDKLGLKVNWIKFTSGAAQYAALAGDRINLAWGGVGPQLLAYANGADVHWIATVMDYNGVEAIVVPPSSTVKSIKELSGKKIGLVTGSDAHYGLLKALQENGMSPHSINILNMQPPQQVAALLNGDVDAVFTWAPFLFQLQDRGAHAIFNNGDLKYGPGYLGWAGKKAWLDRHRSDILKLLRGWDMGLQKMKEAPQLAIRYTVEYTGMDKHQAEEGQKALRYFPADGMLDPNSPVYWSSTSGLHGFLDDYAKFAQTYKLVKSVPDVDSYMMTDFVKAYRKSKESHR
ncbi:MAG TPA: NrtA/SsuA/CpmA family ABC transporter substrate-binding protein [Burkholderiales bacterium]|jgi:ABC-type nitrate/sulfonate/bicarbonate transport system substrate-binding protein|nr:NrtA/SsuA/CpmA family ABC transporter substrate-binding protein [Burkholderiales bacterium]